MKLLLRVVHVSLVLTSVGFLPLQAAEETVRDTRTFELYVVGPDSKPVPNARLEVRTHPIPNADQIQRGKFLKKSTYGVWLATDADGKLTLQQPEVPSNFMLKIETPGYGPFWAGWSSQPVAQSIPARFTAELESGWSVGGVVVDSDGKPVAGAEVHPSVKYKKREGDLEELYVGTRLKTDSDGKWRFDSVPASKNELFVEVSHTGFKPDRRSLTRSQFGLELDQPPVTKIVLDRGLIVTGRVTDDQQQPISGALVRTKFLNDERTAQTDNEGIYRLGGCEPSTAKIVVSAKGRATDMRVVTVDPDMDPVDFQMKPGGKVRIRVLDEKGSPVPKARIFFQEWRGQFSYFEFDHVSQYADEKGVWEWNEAPLDEFKADICHPDGMELGGQSLIARDEEFVFRVPEALVISGRVIDAKTKAPIKAFHVTPGVRSSETHMNWVPKQQFAAVDGKYEIRHTHDYFAHLIRIEASGYQSAISRDIKSNEGKVTIDFELKRGEDVTAVVLMPDGKPAVGAKVALGVGGSQISIKNGDLDGGSTYAPYRMTDSAGKFQFSSQTGPFQLVILHPAGYAHVHASPEMPVSKTIQLEAWARVEGTFRVGKHSIPNARITINSETFHSYGKDVPSIFSHYDVTTQKDGGYVFERVAAGPARIGRRIMLLAESGAVDVTCSCMIATEFQSGETKRLDLGGSGLVATGKLQPPQGFEGKVAWNFALISAEAHLPYPPEPKRPEFPAEVAANPVKKAEWLQRWKQTPEGIGWAAWETATRNIQHLRDKAPHFQATVDRDGTFRFEDLLPGHYVLSIYFSRQPAGSLEDYTFVVPPTDPKSPDPLLDLGVITLKP